MRYQCVVWVAPEERPWRRSAGDYSLLVVDDAKRARLVEPFYLKMMRTNALEHGPKLLPAIADAGKDATASDVVMLLRDPWRSTVMGAWLALLHPDAGVREALQHALGASLGSLDAPPLATAAVVLLGEDALTALQEYSTRDASAKWGACGFVAAAIEHLEAVSSACSPRADDRRAFAAMLGLADRLRELG